MRQGPDVASARLPLPTLLSQLLIALTISLDNEFEHRMPHRTTMGRQRGLPPQGPWLVSWRMWSDFMRLVPPDGERLGDLRAQPGVGPRGLGGNNPGMVRWGYVTLDLPPGATAGDRTPLEDMIVRPTSAGRRAQDIWRQLASYLEPSWRTHLGSSNLDALRGALIEVLRQVDLELPRYVTSEIGPATPRRTPVDELDLTALLAQVLLLFTVDYELDAGHRLYLAANGLRAIDPDGTPIRDLPRRTGIGKEAVNLTIGPRHRGRFVVTEQDADRPKVKVARLTDEGRAAKATYERLPAAIERTWAKRFGASVAALRAAAETMVGGAELGASPALAKVIEPQMGCWRTWVKPRETLPHHPQPNHRGGYPDGV
jgi:hypothetical protein